MTLTKDHLISSIGNRLGISKFESSRIVESVLETVKASLSTGEDVKQCWVIATLRKWRSTSIDLGSQHQI
jgi:hypothetical protein